MEQNFNKNAYKNTDKIYKVIIDTDPGVDDAACLIYAFFDENIDIRLLTAVSGNTSLDKTTRNLLHLTELFGVDIPVARGAHKPMSRERINAEFIHQAEGLGGYIPPTTCNGKLLCEDAVEAMYNVIMQNDAYVIPIILGPYTNLATLFTRHPEVIKKIPRI